MDGDKTIGPLALQQLGQGLQGGFGIQTRLPFRLYSLVEQLLRTTKEDDYVDNAADAMRLAQHAYSSSDKTRLIELARRGSIWPRRRTRPPDGRGGQPYSTPSCRRLPD
jgi:hypothetical protein